jgi:two-component system sensor kinase FixL
VRVAPVSRAAKAIAAPRAGRGLWTMALYVVAYVFLDWVSYLYPVRPLAITPWNPPPGLSLVLLLVLGLRAWPALLLAAFLAELLVREVPASPIYLLAASALVTLCYTAIAMALRRLRFDPGFTRLRDLFWLAMVVVPGTLVIALLYVGFYELVGVLRDEEFVASVLRFWIGDTIGIMVTVPLLLVHGPRVARRAWARPTREMLAQALGIALALWIIFGVPYTDEYKFFYLLFLPLVWIAMRHGIEGATIALPAIQLGLIAALGWAGHGAHAVVEFQFLMLALTITGLFLGMAVSERRRTQEALTAREAELHRAQRLAGASEMASALAHELNQPLTALSNYARACQEMLRLPGDQRARLTAATDRRVDETVRAARVVERLREFFRAGALRLERLDAGALVRAAIETVEKRAVREHVTLRAQLPPDLPPLAVDRVHMETALHNLLVNAIEALRGRERGARFVDVSAGRRDEATMAIRVCDSGPGVPPDVGARLFQPFVTGKAGGMGLGLAISRTLVEAHGGSLALAPDEGSGACFEIVLPLAPENDATPG